MEFVWVVSSGADGNNDEVNMICSTKEKAKKEVEDIMNGYINPVDNGWRMFQDGDKITWCWFYNIDGKVRQSDRYVRIMRWKVK